MARSKFEIKAQKELEADGYQVDYKLRPRFANSHYNTDYWNLFDLLCYKKNEPIRAISIKGKAGVPGEHRRHLIDFKAPGIIKEVWMYRKLASDRRRFVPRKEII